VRIGGIYALERIARDSPKDHPTVMEVLTAFIREHSREPWLPPETASGALTEAPSRPRPPRPGPHRLARTVRYLVGREPTVGNPPEQERLIRPDVQAAVTVVGRRNKWNDRQVIDLSRAVLRDADLTSANLAGADLTGADLSYSRLGIALKLTGGANLTNANLTNASLRDANLTRVSFRLANLTGADLTGAREHLSANFREADLSGAKWSEDVLPPVDWVVDRTPGRNRGRLKHRLSEVTDHYL
jgi:hypothetical protein